MRARAEERRHTAAAAADNAADAIRARFLETFADWLTATPRPAVSGYWAMRDELDVTPLLGTLDALGHACALPVAAGSGQPLTFRRWRPGAPLITGPFGTSEPPEGALPVTPAIVLAPLLAFDHAGGRLGYGAGYYDATLAELRRAGDVLAVGIGYDAQEVEATPMDGGDQRLDWVITETRAIRCRK